MWVQVISESGGRAVAAVEQRPSQRVPLQWIPAAPPERLRLTQRPRRDAAKAGPTGRSRLIACALNAEERIVRIRVGDANAMSQVEIYSDIKVNTDCILWVEEETIVIEYTYDCVYLEAHIYIFY